MSNIDVNRVMTGAEGTVFINGKPVLELSSCEFKVSLEQEDIKFCGSMKTYKRNIGFTGEGTITVKKVNSYFLNLIKPSFKDGVNPDITIISSVQDKITKQTEQIAYKDVTFTELNLASFEAGAIMEQEIPLNFADFEVLDSIDN